MEFKKCKRCGCFFMSDNDICVKCAPKDNFEIIKLRNYLNNNEVSSFDEISSNLSIAPANLARYIENDEFKNICKNIGKNSSCEGFNNISISL